VTKGIDRIWYPGEREGEIHEQRSRDGIPLDSEVMTVFKEIAGNQAASVHTDASGRTRTRPMFS